MKLGVGVVMGSVSDLPVMEAASVVLTQLEIPHELRVLSAHRTPVEADDFIMTAPDRGIGVVICA
ncbi:MAG: AIR carboxylase family protein, partial [Myxococcota bacterium]|nr:AIR carboxylase family protein [Myxococcota bacterium]